MEGKWWICKYFCKKRDVCIDKSKCELWEGNESNGDSRSNSNVREFKKYIRPVNNTTSKCK